MECVFAFMGLIALIAWVIRKIDASQTSDNHSGSYRRPSGDGQVYSDAFLALDAAEDGIFTPWGEDAVRRADRAFSGHSSGNQYDSDDMDWDEPRDYDEEDPWGPV